MALNGQEQIGVNELTCLNAQARDYARRSKADSTLTRRPVANARRNAL